MNISRVIAVAAILCSPMVHAEDTPVADNCTAKIKQLDNIERSEGAGQHGGVATQIREQIAKAKEAQAKGDGKACLSAANKALELYRNASD
ncbi:hypothetical protein [Pseudomonas entomophila]|uniref:hypothetical protein n=1 Tax=Pseudomonas entomophila TaxID=312306 RepID=UPI001F019D5A|nr:hypothetical protein [Pseudomonas entomophila]MCG8291354.1 hypothetical protein [Pseudomonas entomophila]